MTSPTSDQSQMAVDPEWDHESDSDSTLSEQPSSTTSISASILEYRKLHGRTYQNFNTGTEYWGPNDERQNEGLDLTHHMLYLALDNKLFLAPISDNPQKVIDIGTGTGIWAMQEKKPTLSFDGEMADRQAYSDFADQFPSAEVIGTDLSPIQPPWVPANCKFELDDAQLSWPYPDNHFDYIHIRCLMGSIKDWPALYREIHRCLKPGGWFEHMDYSIDVLSDDDTIPKGSPLDGWGALFQEAGERMGRTFKIIENGRNIQWLRDAAFENIDSHRFKLPLGGWPADPKWKEIGQYNQVIIDESLEGYVLFLLTNVMGWDYTKVQAFIAQTRRTFRDRSVHSYCEVGSVWGQKGVKPEDTASPFI